MELNRDQATLCLDFATFYLCVREPKVGEGNRWKEEGIKTSKDRAFHSDTGDGLLFASSQEPPLASPATLPSLR